MMFAYGGGEETEGPGEGTRVTRRTNRSRGERERLVVTRVLGSTRALPLSLPSLKVDHNRPGKFNFKISTISI